MVKINFSQTTGGFKPLTPGTYDAIISSAKNGTSQSGNPKLDVTFDLVADPDRGVDAGRKCWATYSLQPQALWKLGKVMTALQIDTSQDYDPSEIPELILGREVRIEVADPDPGFEYNRVIGVSA